MPWWEGGAEHIVRDAGVRVVRLVIVHVLIAGDNTDKVHGGGDSGVQRVICLGQGFNNRGQSARLCPPDIHR